MGEKQSQIAITILLHEVPNETSLQFNMERGKEIFYFDLKKTTQYCNYSFFFCLYMEFKIWKGDHSYIENFFKANYFFARSFLRHNSLFRFKHLKMNHWNFHIKETHQFCTIKKKDNFTDSVIFWGRSWTIYRYINKPVTLHNVEKFKKYDL